MEIKQIYNNLFGSNIYVIYQNDKALIIDPGSDYDNLCKFITDNNLRVRAVLLTHGHFDHAYSAYKFEEENIPIFIASADRNKVLKDGDMSYFSANTFTPCKSTYVFNKALLQLDEFTIRVYQTPGHTMGCVSLLIEDNLFTGDLVFSDGVGRYDLYDSNEHALVTSLKRICLLNNDIRVYPGHGSATTIKEIKNYLNLN